MISFRQGIFSISFFLMLIFSALDGACQIDVPKWVDDIGGPNSNCISSAVKVDNQNNVYVTGIYNGTADFDPSSAVYNLNSVGGSFDTFVAKYTSAGKFIWAVSFGSDGTDQVNSLTVDINGNPIISGQYNSNSMTVGSTTLINQGDWDGFIIKLNTNGGVVWAKSIGGGATDYGGHVSSDSQGNIIENLRYQSTINVGGQTYSSQSGSSFNGITIKYNPAGNVLWAVNIADPQISQSMFSEFDSQNNVVVCGSFQSNDNFNPLGSAVYLNGNGGASFLAKYNSSGILVWAQAFYGAVVNNNTNLCINSNNDIYVDGPFSSPLTFGTTTLNNSGGQDIFLAKYSSAGVFQSAGDVGGNGSIYNYGILSSKDNNIYVSGYFSGTLDFDPSPTSVSNISDHGQQDFFLAKYDSNLNYKWAFNGGNANCSSNLGRNVAIDNNNNVLFTGGFCSTVNFSASTCSPYNLTAQSDSRDCFLAQYTQSVATVAAQITAFTVPQQTIPAVIDQTNLKITVTVPKGTDVSALVPTIAYSNNIILNPASGVTQNFTAPVTYKLLSSCTSLNYTVNVVLDNTVVPIPVTVCSGSSTTLAGNVISPVPDSYTWQIMQGTTWVNAAGTINNANYQTAIFTNTSNANEIFSFRRQTISQGTTSYDSYYNVTVLPAIAGNTITAPAVVSFCSTGTPSTITGGSPTGGTNAYTYQWQSSPDSLTFTNITGAITASYTPPTLTSTTYYRRVVTSGTCAITSNSNVIGIKVSTPPATPTVTTPIEYICAGSSATFKVANPQTGITYNWYNSTAKTKVLFTGPTYVTGPVTANAIYYVDAENGGCASASMASAQVIEESLPSAPIVSSNSASLCYGAQGTFTDSTPENGYFNWYLVPTGGTPIASGENYTIPPITADITYYLEGVSNNGCLSATRTAVAITVIPLPSPPQTQAPVLVCPGSSAVINVPSPQAGFTYNWYTTATGGTSSHTGISFTTPVITVATTYYIETVNATGCVAASRTAVQVNLSQPPETPIPASPVITICKGSYTLLLPANPQASISYNWYDSAAKTNLLFTGTGYTTGIINTDTTFYFEAINGTCTSPGMASVQVNVTAVPATPVLSNNAPQICSGSPAALSVVNPQAGITYNWYTTATGGTAVANGTSFTTTALGANTSYFVEAVNNNSCPSPTRAEADITVNPIPGSPGIVSAYPCYGSPATLTVTPTPEEANFTFNWYTTPTGGTPVFTGLSYVSPPLTATTTFYAEAVSPAGCVSSRGHLVILITPLPSTPVPTNPVITICTGSPAALSVSNPQAGITYNWYDSATKTNLLGSGPTYTTVPVNANTTFYVDAENGTCPSPSIVSVQVNVTSAPVVPVLTNNILQICAGSPVTLSVANPQAGLTYNWYAVATGGTPLANGSSFTTGAINANTSYFVEADNGTGCSSPSRAEADITIDPIPASPGMGANSICAGSQAVINISPIIPGLAYNWYTVPTGGTPVFTGTSYTTPPLTTQTTFYAEAVNAAGCASTRAALAVIVNVPPPVPTPTNAIQTVCTGGLATLSVANPQPGITYNWYDSADRTNRLASGSTYTSGIINANTTFYVDAENGSCQSTLAASVQVNVVAAPVAPVINNIPSQVCPGSSVALSITNPQAGYTYNWFTNSATVSPVNVGTAYTISNITINVAYIVEAVNSNGCSSSTPVDIAVLPIPAAPQIQTPAAICVGSSTTINIASPQSSLTYNWYTVATGGTQFFSGTSYNTPPILNATATYYIEAVNSLGCPSPTRTAVQVTPISPPATPVPVSAVQSICPGSMVTLSVANPQSGITYNWYNSPTANTLLSTGSNYTVGPLTANTTYYVQASNGTCNSSSLASVQVNIVNTPAAPAVTNSQAQTCYGTQFTASIASPQADFTYNWYAVATGGSVLYTGTDYTTSPLTSGTTYYAEAVNSTGCPSPTRTPVSITILPAPSIPVTAAAGPGICPGTSTSVSATPDAGTSIQWFSVATGGTAIATGNNYATPNLNITTTYYAQEINDNNCTSTTRVAATVIVLQQLAAPVVTVGTTNTTSVTFEWAAVDGATGYQVSTDNGVTFTAPSSGTDGLSHTVTGLQVNQSVTIIVQATGVSSCQLSGSSTAVTGIANYPPNDIIYVANTFTPNGDGKNDIVYVHGNSIKSMNFFVYDQWGEMLFKSSNQSVGWDGTFRGAREPVGVYVYFVQAIMSNGDKLTKKGTITLLR